MQVHTTSGEKLLLPKAARTGIYSHRTMLIMTILLVASMSGCTGISEYIHNGFKVGPNYRQPAAPVANQWLEANDPTLDTARWDDATWWQNFNDPVLNCLVDMAYQQNLSVRAACMRVMEARALRAIAVGELFPQSQEAFGDYTRFARSKNGPAGIAPNLHFDEWTFGTALSWELDFWGRYRRAIESADANLDASVENYDDVLVILLSDVAQSYTSVRIAEQRLAYALENVKIQKGSLSLAEDRLRQGVTTRLDVTQAQSDLKNTEAGIPLFGSSATSGYQPVMHPYGHAAAGHGCLVSEISRHTNCSTPGCCRHSSRSAATAAGCPPCGT